MKRDLAQLKEELQAGLMTYARAREERIAKSRTEEQAAASVSEWISEIMKLTEIDLSSVRGPYRVIENGDIRYVSGKEAKKLIESAKAHLLLDVIRRRLRYVRMEKKGVRGRPKWTDVSWGIFKVLKVGMTEPDVPFGNLTIERVLGGRMSCRTLSRYMADITKLIQGGGTKGPYVRHVSGIHDESQSGRGYVFDARFHYLVVERSFGKECGNFIYNSPPSINSQPVD